MNATLFISMKSMISILLFGFIIGITGCEADDPETNKEDVIITWKDPADIEYGTPLGATQLNATANAMGDFVYTPPLGTILEVGNNQDLTVDFTPYDVDVYKKATKTVTINVLKAKSWVLSQKIIQWIEPWKGNEFTYLTDVPWNVVFSMVNKYGTTLSTVFTGSEGNVTRTRTDIESNGNSTTSSKTDTWSLPPSEMIPGQTYTVKMKSTRVNGLGNGMSITGFGTYDEAMSGYIPATFNQTAFDWDGEKSLDIKLIKPTNNEDALKKRVLRVNLASGSGGVGTENNFSYLYVYEWK